MCCLFFASKCLKISLIEQIIVWFCSFFVVIHWIWYVTVHVNVPMCLFVIHAISSNNLCIVYLEILYCYFYHLFWTLFELRTMLIAFTLAHIELKINILSILFAASVTFCWCSVGEKRNRMFTFRLTRFHRNPSSLTFWKKYDNDCLWILKYVRSLCQFFHKLLSFA